MGILKDFHKGHIGIATMKALMRNYVFWPNMHKEAEENIKPCRRCTIAAKVPSVKFTPWPKTDRPWLRLHTDFVDPLKGPYCLIVVDSFSKWLEEMKCKNPT